MKSKLMDGEYYDKKTIEKIQEFESLFLTTSTFSKQLESHKKQITQLESEIIPSLEKDIEIQARQSMQFETERNSIDLELKTLRSNPKPTIGRVMFLRG